MKPGPNSALFNKPFYVKTGERFVSPNGNDNADGMSTGTAWKTLSKADTMRLPRGTVVTLLDGNYAHPQTIFRNGGAESAADGFIVYRALNMGKAKLMTTQPMSHMAVLQTNYVIFDGIEFDGNNNMAGNSGIESSRPSGGPGHHIFILNTRAHHCGQAGFSINNSEFNMVLCCETDFNSSKSGYFGSGISLYEPEALQNYTRTTFDNYLFGNYGLLCCFNNSHQNNNPGTDANGNSIKNSDGNGIIIDDWRHTQAAPNVSYKGGGLVYENWTWKNGGKGIQVFICENVTVANNRAHGNNWDTHNDGSYRGEITVDQCGNVKVMNNAAQALGGASPPLSYGSPYCAQRRIAPNTFSTNIGFGGRSNNMGSGDSYPIPNNANADPQFVDPANGDLSFKSTSPCPALFTTPVDLPKIIQDIVNPPAPVKPPLDPVSVMAQLQALKTQNADMAKGISVLVVQNKEIADDIQALIDQTQASMP